MSELVLRAECHPEACGRSPLPGEQAWDFKILLEDGVELHLLMGKAGHDAFRGFILHEELDDAADAAVRP